MYNPSGIPEYAVKTKRGRDLALLGELKNEASSYIPHWQDMSRLFRPRAGRFLASDHSQGGRKHNNIYDNTPLWVVRILAAGLQSGLTNPKLPWFKLSTEDPELNKNEAVKVWLAEVTRIMLAVFSKANTYNMLHTTYEELAVFGTACAVKRDHFDNIVHHDTLTIGEFYVGTDDFNKPNQLGREFENTVLQMVKRFGKENCSQTVQNLYNDGRWNAWVPVYHIIKPREERDRSKKDAKNMAFASCYLEPGRDDAEDRYLRESGYEQYPALVSRWVAHSNDIYGDAPGMEGLGDARQLQHEQLRKAEGIDFQTKPPLQVPTKLRGKALNRLPGGVTYYDGTAPGAGVKSLFEVNLNLQHLLEDILDVRDRLKRAFYTDLFFAISSQSDHRMTATEVAARNQEQLLQLGPVLERLHNELLRPLIDDTFATLIRNSAVDGRSILPPPPEDLDGVELKIEYTSILAAAQRAVDVNATDRYVLGLGQVATFKPEVLDKFDQDRYAEIYADRLGIDPELVVADQQVALIRKNRAEDQQAMQQAAMLQAGADTAQKLSQSDTGGKNALTDLTQQTQE